MYLINNLQGMLSKLANVCRESFVLCCIFKPYKVLIADYFCNILVDLYSLAKLIFTLIY